MKAQLVKGKSMTESIPNQCCMLIKEALIELYIEVKVRNEVSIKAVTNDVIEQEKEKLRYLDSMDLIEYLRSSIEILLSLNLCGASQDDTPNKHLLGDQSALKKTPSVQCNTSILNRNIPDDDEEMTSEMHGAVGDDLSNVEIPTTRMQSTAKKQVPKQICPPRHQRKHQIIKQDNLQSVAQHFMETTYKRIPPSQS